VRDDIDEPTALALVWTCERISYRMARATSNGFARPPGSSRRFSGARSTAAASYGVGESRVAQLDESSMTDRRAEPQLRSRDDHGDRHYAIFGDLNQQGSLSPLKCERSQNGRGGLFFMVERHAAVDKVTALVRGDAARAAHPSRAFDRILAT